MPTFFTSLEHELQRYADLEALRLAYTLFADEGATWNLWELVAALCKQTEENLGYWSFSPDDIHLAIAYLTSVDKKWRFTRLAVDDPQYYRCKKLSTAIDSMLISGLISLPTEFRYPPTK